MMMCIKVRVSILALFHSVIPLFVLLPNIHHPHHFSPQHIESLMKSIKLDEYVDLENKDTCVSPFLDLVSYWWVTPH